MEEGPASDPLPTPTQAWNLVACQWTMPEARHEATPLLEAVGRVTAHAVHSPCDSPPFDRAAMDGYAVRAADLAGSRAGETLRVVGEVRMGQPAELDLDAGQAIWVATGSMIPPGADAVVNVERTRTVAGQVCVEGPVKLGDHISRRASDLPKGAAVLGAGRRLRPQDAAVLASLGLAHVLVMRKPRVAILLTGDELCLPGESLAPGQIYTSNGYALAGQIAQAGGNAVVWPLLPDDLGAIVAAFQEALATADLILISGGSSVGKRDLTAQALEATAGTRLLVEGVAAKPGRPSIVATVGDRLVIGIPGNPMAAMISFAMFGEPALRALLRLSAEETAAPRGGGRLVARLTAPLTSRRGRQEYIPVRLEPAGDRGWGAAPVSGTSAGLAGMVYADGLITVAPEVDCLTAGKEVEVTVF